MEIIYMTLANRSNTILMEGTLHEVHLSIFYGPLVLQIKVAAACGQHDRYVITQVFDPGGL